MENGKRVTIKDVARVAGVAHTTVSRVIHDDARISDQTKSRVRRVMRSLAYQPNLVARGLVRNKTQVIALITPELQPYALPIVRGVAESCSKRDYAIMLFPTNAWLRETLSFEWVSQNWLVDGVLVYNLIYHDKVPAEILDLHSRDLPFVFLNKFLQATEVNAVGVDNEQGVLLAVDHLATLGHRRIGLLNGDITSVDGKERFDAFRTAMGCLGLSYDERFVGCGMWREADAYRETKRLLASSPRPTALCSVNDEMAIGAVHAAHDLGLRVPNDVALIGFDDLDIGRYIEPALTTVRPPAADVGPRALDLLMEVVRDPTRPPEQIGLPSELVVRASTVRS